mgnify:CR=1 FL=1
MRMPTAFAIAAAIVLTVPAVPAFTPQAAAYEVEHYYVYCANDRIEVSFWDLEQMKVRRGSDVCQFMSYTSYSDALTFAGSSAAITRSIADLRGILYAIRPI